MHWIDQLNTTNSFLKIARKQYDSNHFDHKKPGFAQFLNAVSPTFIINFFSQIICCYFRKLKQVSRAWMK